MGRRPSPLITEFFARGEKLGHNRYHHRCKRCGEDFPKGRIDSLTSHLLRKCAGLTQEDRESVFEQIQRNPSSSQGGERRCTNVGLPDQAESDLNAQLSSQTHQQHQTSALDTLAEVSRQHLDYSAYNARDRYAQDGVSLDLSDVEAQQALLAELRAHTTGAAYVETGPSNCTSDRVQQQVQSFKATDPPLAVPYNSLFSSSPLVHTATAANEHLEMKSPIPHETSQGTASVDPELAEQPFDNQSHAVGLGPAKLAGNAVMHAMPQLANSSGPIPRPLRELHFASGFLQKPTGIKKRGRFEESRRKQVSEIRKRGACIRCRMLKKPCSEGTPCSTCASVGAARLWKGKCVRTRLADECSMFFRDSHIIQAEAAISAAKQRSEGFPQPSRIKVRLFSESDRFMSFPVIAYSLDPDLITTGAAQRTRESSAMVLLGDEKALSDKIEEYIECIVEACIAHEPSLFVRSTLQHAHGIGDSEDRAEATQSPHQSERQRLSYTINNQCMRSAVQLWLCTSLLNPNDALHLQLHYDSSEVPSTTSESLSSGEGHHTSNDMLSDSSQSYYLIRTQLLAAIEWRCSRLSKIVMNELEKRLLQRQPTYRFETFLSSVIFLIAAERMCNFSSDPNIHNDPVDLDGSRKEASQSGPQTDEPTKSPASGLHDSSPLSLWSEGQQFCGLLTMLLRMRGLLPKLERRPDGMLKVVSPADQVLVNGELVSLPGDEQTYAAAAWLDPLQLNVAGIVSKSQESPKSATDSFHAWDMRFVSQLLLAAIA